MKAIFAVTALAAAISGQALAADTEATTTFTGSMDAAFSIDLANDATKSVDLVDDSDDNAGYELTMEIAVVNGPFSATVGIEAIDDDDDSTTSDAGDDDLSDTLELTIGDIVVSEGKVSFGQVGNLMETDEYVDGTVGMSDDNTTLGDDIGFRYMVAEGATVQLGGEAGRDSTIFLAGQYMGSADALDFVVEAEVEIDDAAVAGADDMPMFVGAGVTYTLDVATITAGYNYSADNTGATDSEYAIDVQTTLGDATVGLGYYEPSTEGDDDEELGVEVGYAVSEEISVSAGYTYTTAESAGDEVTAGVAYAAGMLSASADLTLGNFDADTADSALIELNVTYTTESGIGYYADYAMQAAEAAAVTAIAEQSKITLGARYAF